MSTPETPNAHVPPVPRYGEYANPGYAPPAYTAEPVPPAPFSVQPTAPRPRRTWDLVLSIVLLVVGLFGVLLAIFNAATIDFQMEALYEEYGVTQAYEAGPATAIGQAVIIVSHLLLYVVAIVVTLLLIRKNRVSFWVPLSIGALAFIVFIVTLIVLVLSDPVLFDAAMQQQQQ